MPRLSEVLILHVRQHEIVWKYIIRTYSGTEEAELHIFGSQGRAEVRKRVFTSLGMKAEQKCGSGTSDLWRSRQSRNAEELWKWRQSISEEAELQIFDSQGRKWKYGSGTSHLWKSRQKWNAEAELHTIRSPGRSSAVELEIFQSHGRAKCGKRNLRSLPVKVELKCGSGT